MTISRKGWIIAAICLALLLVMATFPMRLALGLAGSADAGMSARAVRGSIWSSELVDARLGVLPLGTVRAALSPLALLTGDVELEFSRTDDRLGALSGRLHGSQPRGASQVNGVTSLAGGLGLIPADAIRFENTRIRFNAAGKCVDAHGSLQLSIPTSIAGLDLSRGLAGPLRCSQGRARAVLASQSGMERLILSFDGSGAYRVHLAIETSGDPALMGALTALGFRPSSDGFVLVTMGQL